MRTAARCLAALLVATGCSLGIPEASAPPTERPIRGGVLVEAYPFRITTLQPAFDKAEARAHRLIYATLAVIDQIDAQTRPGLATWQQSADGRTLDWRIARDAVWSDGRPIVADDVLTFYRVLRYSTKANPVARAELERIEGMSDFFSGGSADIPGIALDPSDPKRFTVRVLSASCIATDLFVRWPPLPAHVFGKYLEPGSGAAIDRAPENDAPPVASGPFVFGSSRPDDELRLLRNERYHRGAPLLDAYVFKKVALEGRMDQLLDGLAQYAGGLKQSEVRSDPSDPRMRSYVSSQGAYIAIGWNTQSATAPALRDPRIRQALAYGLDGRLALSKIEGLGGRMDSHHPRGHWAHPGGLQQYDHDVAKARALIESAGYRRGADGVYRQGDRELAFTIKTNVGNKTRASLVQFAVDHYRALGLRVTGQDVPFEELIRELVERDTIEAFVLGWGLPPEPGSDRAHAMWHSSNLDGPRQKKNGLNVVRFAHPELDAAFDRAREGPDCSVASRQREYATFNRILNEEQPFYFGFGIPDIRAVSARLRGFEPGVFSSTCCLDLHDVHKWWLAPEKK